MIEAVTPSGELRRPGHEGQKSTCYACGNTVVAVRVPQSKNHAWSHQKTRACPGPDDGWRERLREGFLKHGFSKGTAGDHVHHDDNVVAFADGPQPVLSALLDAFESDTVKQNDWLTWVVDGRFASLAFGRNHPGHRHPSFVAGAQWSPFVQTWMAGREGVTVAIELGYCLPGKQDEPVFFVACKPWLYSVRRCSGDLASLPITGANGYLVTFAQLVQHAKDGRGPHTVDTHPLDRYRYDGNNIHRVYH